MIVWAKPKPSSFSDGLRLIKSLGGTWVESELWFKVKLLDGGLVSELKTSCLVRNYV